MIYKLNQLASINSGYPFRGSIPENVGAGTYAVQLKDVAFGEAITWEACLETNITSKKEPDWLKRGDILFSARGNRYYTMLVGEEIGARKVVPVPHFYVIRVTSDVITPEFLAWLINQKPCQQYFEKQAEGSVTKSIRRTILEHTLISVPPLNEQLTIIELDKTLKKEQQCIKQIVQNGETLMNTISKNLYAMNNI